MGLRNWLLQKKYETFLRRGPEKLLNFHQQPFKSELLLS